MGKKKNQGGKTSADTHNNGPAIKRSSPINIPRKSSSATDIKPCDKEWLSSGRSLNSFFSSHSLRYSNDSSPIYSSYEEQKKAERSEVASRLMMQNSNNRY